MNNSNDQQNYQSAPNDGERIDLKNYIPDPNRRNELKKRLYDSGISNIPMPSVKRPIEENISSKPYSAKMNPSKIQNTSPKKKDIERLNKNIINQLKMSYEEAAVQESKYKGEGTAEYYKSQHIMVPPPQFIQGMKKGPERLVPKLGRTESGVKIDGLSSTNRKLLNKGPKPSQLPSLGGNYNSTMGGQSQLDNMRLLQGPPSMVMAGFEGGYSLGQKNLELARSKFLVDKLTGKLPEELRGGMSTKLPPLSGEDREALQSRGSISRTGLKKEDDDEDKKKDTVTQQKWSDLDKYIELLLDSKSEEETVFVYLNPNPNSDPYDLLVSSYQDRTPQKYYTLSGKGLTLYENDMPIEFLSLGQWLIERDSYNHIKELDFFKKFKKWKFMRMWKKTIKHMQRMKAQNALEEKLFILQDHFMDHLFIHRRNMIEMEKMRFVDTCINSETNEIEEFASRQYDKIAKISDDIKILSDKSRINIRECISEVVGELRTRIVSEIALDEERKKNNPIQSSNTITTKRKASSNVFEKLGFPDGMTYGHRSSLRKECSRFLRFAYLVDFLSLEALSNIYTGSVHDMINRLKTLNDDCKMDEVMNKDYDDQEGATAANQGQDPLFYVEVQLCDEQDIPENEVQQVEIEEFTKDSKIEDFDPTAHLELEQPKPEGEEEDENDDQQEQEDVPKEKIYKKIVPNIQDYWLRMNPAQENYIEILVKTFATGLEKIKKFERWSKHSDFTIYADALEDWDDIVGDSWDEPDSLMLEPRTWIQEHPLHENQKQMVEEIINNAFSKMKFFLTRFQPILEIYWRNKQINLEDILMDEKLKNPVEGITNTINLFIYQHEYFSSKLPNKADIGLIQLDSKSARGKIQPTANQYKDKIAKFIPEVLKERNLESQDWLKKQIRKLSIRVEDVEQFVQQDEYYRYISENFQDVRDRVDMFGQIYAKMKEFSFKIRQDETNSFNESLAAISQLAQLVQEVESTQEGKKEEFKKIVAQMVPVLDKQITEIYEEAQHEQFLSGNSDLFDMIKILDGLEDRFKELENTSIKYNKWQEVLETQPTVFKDLEDAREQLNLRSLMWHSLDKWQTMSEKWLKTPFSNVDAKDIGKTAENYFRTAMRLEKTLDPNPIQIKLKEQVEQFKAAMPIVTAFRNDKLLENHWAEIKALINKDFDMDNEDFTLKSLIDLDVTQFQEEITAISTQATQEFKLRQQIEEIDQVYRNTLWEVKHDEKTDSFILGDPSEVYQVLDDTLSNINMILGSRFVKPLREEAETWKKLIMTLSDMVDQWYDCQRKWQYLENIFRAQDIKTQLKEESQNFQKVNNAFKQLMVTAEKQKKCIYWAKQKANTLDQLIKHNEVLDAVEKALKDYMETKRVAFPRFYFLSDDELIDILANSQNLEIIQGHLKTCFDNIVRVEVEEGIEIKAMISNEKEKVPFKKPVKARNNIESWLMQLQEEMVTTLQNLLKQGVQDYYNEKVNKNRVEFVEKHYGQIVATVCQIKWCEGTAQAIDDQSANVFALEEWLTQNIKQIEELIVQVRGKLEPVLRKIIVALVTVDVHARDIVDELKQQNVSSVNEFKWIQQLRYYWEEEQDTCVIRQVSATLNYAYEYMGATSRLVITPLTDRCWITISNALHIKLGANPAGPAGTGKTESTKDLAKALAIQCIVFNCSDQVDYLMMARLFSGLCQQGCWTCLDEFNRIKIEVLSVVAMQLLQVRTALLAEKQTFTFEDSEIELKTTFGCHITMNPGYAGRTELPDNLQVLFRPVAMMIPDYGLIAEIMLGAEGFADAKQLSKKMVKLYSLSAEQLSQQDHYDFGLRAVKSVLVMAGSLKRANPTLVEDSVLIRAMRDANVPKFLRDDLPLFAAIIQDLFPTIQISPNEYGNLEVTIKEMTEKADLQVEPVFIKKVIELYETFNVRFGVMLVGLTGSGKTRCYEVLEQTFNILRERGDPNETFQFVKKQVLNPKAISMGEMYGEVNEMSQEWYDGLASKIMRSAAQETGEDRTWVVFDGPVDAIWIENMNTVLDDNMTLCLANGQRIKLRSQMKMLFEVQDLAVASPATVSRCGMVYLTVDELGWRPYVKTWIKTYFTNEEEVSEALREHIWNNFNYTIDNGLEFIYSEKCSEGINTTPLQQVVSICNFMEYFLHEDQGLKGSDEEKKKQIDCVMSWAYAWGMGGSLDIQSKERFDSVVKDQFKNANYPPAFTVFDYFYDLKAKDKQFKPWTDKVAAFKYDKEMSYFDLMVPTTDTTKYSYCLEVLLKIQKPIFFTGGSGTGKTAVIANKLIAMKEKDNVVYININMSAQTSSIRTQASIEEKLEKVSRTCFGPPAGKKTAIFVDDINMPAVEYYGAQPPIELLRLFVDRAGMYQRGEWQWKDVIGTTLIACAAPPSGGRAVLTQRFSRRFNMLCMPEPTPGTLATIFSSILKNFLATGFQEKVKNLQEAAIQSTIDIYTRIQIDLRPTPAKFHYLFNLRDVSKVVQGICMVKPVSIGTDDLFSKLWVNECFRVFYDRLINEEDRQWFKDIIIELLGRNFKSALNAQEIFVENKIMFGDLLKLDSPIQYYENIIDKQKLLKILHGGLDEYNMSNSSKMNLVLFDDALEHILRIARVLKQPRGHIMLIGVGGSGKQSLIKLCTFMRQMEFRMIEITKGFNIDSFKEKMKEYMKEAGIEGKGISYTITDTQIIDEAMIENLNNLLNTGEIPNLMLPEDKEEITNGVRPVCVQKKIVDTVDNIAALFIDRIREYLHICLCMSPVGDTLRVRCRQFPSLVNCCTLDWFARWPEEALLFVSTEFLKELPDVEDDIKAGISEMCMKIHISVEEVSTQFWDSLRRRVYTTPKSYLDLISLYLQVLEQKRNEFHQNKSRLANGVSKLNEANKEIAELNIKLTEMKPILIQKNEELKVALVKVNADKEVADAKEKVVSAEAEVVNKKAAEAQAIADDAQADLDAAEPELKAAAKAVRDLDKNSIVEIKSFTTPPEQVKFVMECVMILLGKKTDWATVKSTLQDVNSFMGSLMDYDVTKTSEKIWKKARDNYINKPQFDQQAVKKVSQAAAALCIWCSASSKYQAVTKKVAPKKAKHAEVTAVLKEAQAELQVKLDEVKKVKDAVEELENQVNKMQNEKKELEDNMNTSNLRMGRAEQLVVLLKDEGVRWKETVEVISEQIIKLVGNVFLSCACISYFGAFTGTYREILVKQWVEGCLERNIPTDEDFDLVTTMGDQVVIRNWNIAGLPNDKVSSENGILTTTAERYPLCIDPQQQANKWLRNLYKNDNLCRLKFGPKDFLRDVIGCVRNGRPLLVEDIEEAVDPAIDPILTKQQYKTEAGIMQIRLGDANHDFDEHFKFFMTTKMPNPHYIPEICIKVTLINFTVTFEGLQQQMLGDVVIAEKPEIEAKRDGIVLQMAADAQTLKDLENNILKQLSEATVLQILDEDTLIDMLKDSKKTSAEVNERMDQAKIVEVEINDTRNMYTNVAIRGSILYFVIADLSGIDPMYQNSLAYVKQLFNTAIAAAPQKDTIDERLDTLIDGITRLIYTNVSRGLFEKDKIIYSFLIITSILRNAKKIDEAIWNIILRGPTVFTNEEVSAKLDSPDPQLLPPIPWDLIYSAELRSEGQFEGISKHICDNWEEWKKWGVLENPYMSPVPGEYEEKLTKFDKMLLIKAFRNELMQVSISDYIIGEMGQFFVEPPSTSMDVIYQTMGISTPLIFVLTQGADPTSILLNFAKQRDMMEKLFPISLGQGQGPKATKLIETACADGNWVMLQNCHLLETWMSDLEKIVLDFNENKESIHEDFRLFLTSMPSKAFPVAVLQNSSKLTVEPPRGMRANIKRSYVPVTQEILEETPKPVEWRKLMFSLTFFHAVIQERRKFGPLGWNKSYSFNDSDLETTFTMLRLFLEQDEVPWEALTFVTGHINYGGRVTDDNDRVLLMTCLAKYCCVDALKDNYKFTPSGTYYNPPDGNIKMYKDYIDSLPLNDPPEIYGLHGNANIKYQDIVSNLVIETILSIQPRLVAAGGGLTPDQIVLEKSRELLAKLPELLDQKEGNKEIFKVNDQGLIPSLSTVLVQEITKFNRLMRKMRQSLSDIDLAINGFIVMSEELDSMYLKIQNNQVPGNWEKVGYACLKPLSSWFKDFLKRIDFFRDWLMNGNPSSYWLPGMFFPQGFMTGVLQTHSRQYQVAIDRLAFSFEFLEAEDAEDIDEAPTDGVYISGLFMDGARWDRENGIITDQFPSIMFDHMPIIHFNPKEDFKPEPEDYVCPLYKTSLRQGVLSTTGLSTNFVVHVATPSKEPPSAWVLRGAAMLCMLDD